MAISGPMLVKGKHVFALKFAPHHRVNKKCYLDRPTAIKNTTKEARERKEPFLRNKKEDEGEKIQNNSIMLSQCEKIK